MNRAPMTRTRLSFAVSAAVFLGVVGGVVGAGVSTASAQAASGPRPPAPSDEPSGAAFSASAVGLILAALVLGAAGMKSKRGHQD